MGEIVEFPSLQSATLRKGSSSTFRTLDSGLDNRHVQFWRARLTRFLSISWRRELLRDLDAFHRPHRMRTDIASGRESTLSPGSLCNERGALSQRILTVNRPPLSPRYLDMGNRDPSVVPGESLQVSRIGVADGVLNRCPLGEEDLPMDK